MRVLRNLRIALCNTKRQQLYITRAPVAPPRPKSLFPARATNQAVTLLAIDSCFRRLGRCHRSGVSSCPAQVGRGLNEPFVAGCARLAMLVVIGGRVEMICWLNGCGRTRRIFRVRTVAGRVLWGRRMLIRIEGVLMASAFPRLNAAATAVTVITLRAIAIQNLRWPRIYSG